MSLIELWKDFSGIAQTFLQATTVVILALGALFAASYTLVTNWTKLSRSVRKHFKEKTTSAKKASSLSDRNASLSRERLGEAKTANQTQAAARKPPAVSEIFIWTEETVHPWHSAYPGRKSAQAALIAMTKMTDIAYDLKVAANRTTRSPKPYAKQLAFLTDLGRAVTELRVQATNLDASLNKLDLHWSGDDPRSLLYFYLDPFAFFESQRSPEHMYDVFYKQAECIAETLQKAGYEIERKPHPWDRRKPVRLSLADARDSNEPQVIREERREL